MIKKKINKYKLQKKQQMEKNNKYIFLFRYYDLSQKDIFKIKRIINIESVNLYFLKQSLFLKEEKKLIYGKGQGPLLYIALNDININLFKNLLNQKKLSLIAIKSNENWFSLIKIKQLLLKQGNSIYFPIQISLVYFFIILKNISKK